MSLFSKLNHSVERVKNKLAPEADPAQAEKQHFQTVSREIRILTARNIVGQIQDREQAEGKMTPEAIREFTVQRSVESGWKDERVCSDITAMVTKLYHLGINLPDHEL